MAPCKIMALLSRDMGRSISRRRTGEAAPDITCTIPSKAISLLAEIDRKGCDEQRKEDSLLYNQRLA